MATKFKITAPDGTVYNVTGPDGATEQDALAQVQAQHIAAPPPPAAPTPMVLPGDPDAAAAVNLGEPVAKTLANVPSSAANLVKNTVTPFLHPIDTAKNLGHTAAGYVEKLFGGGPDVPYADAVNQYFGKRYGGLTNLGQTVQSDPVGALADLSVPLTLGGAAAERAPGVVGEVGSAARTAGEAVNPFTTAGRAVAPAAKVAGNTAANLIGGLGTFTGPLPIKAAFEAGARGGAAGDAFLGNLRGQVPIEGVVADARNAVGNLRKARNADYRDTGTRLGILGGADDSGENAVAAGEGGVAGAGNPATAILDLSPVVKAFADTNDINSFRGVDLSPSTTETRGKLGNILEEWQTNPDDAFRTVAGVDALKRAVGDVRDSSAYGSTDRVIANRVYNAARQTAVDQVPEYAGMMGDYGDASDTIDDIEKTLSLNPKASIDTSLRKLQSSLRDNVASTYGRRADLVDTLSQNGAPNLIPALAGQALKPWTPRGIGPAAAAAEGTAAVLSGNPHALFAAPLMSPRIVGEGAHALGQGIGALGELPQSSIVNTLSGANQAGVISNLFRSLAQARAAQ